MIPSEVHQIETEAGPVLPLKDAGTRRSKNILQASISAIVAKGLVLVANAVSIPIAVRYLGPAQFGVWVTISTTIAMLLVLDLGIANAMTNFISESYALDDKDLAGRYAATGFWVMLLISAGLSLLGAAAWPFVTWAPMFHLSGEENERLISHSVAVAYIIFLVGMPAGLSAKILGGYQELRIVNIVAAMGAVMNLLAIVLVTYLHGGLVALVVASSSATVVTNLACLVWIWIWHKPWLVPVRSSLDRNLAGKLMSSGSWYFILQLAGLFVFNSDNIIIAHYLGPADVTPYSVTWKLVGYCSALQVIITPALWPAYAEAYVRGDLLWIRKTLKRVMLTTMSIAITASFVLVFWGRNLVRLWAGASAVPTETLMVLMCVWVIISTFMANTATVLAATNEIKLQAWLAIGVAVVNLLVSIWLVQKVGSIGVIIGTLSSYALVLIGPQTWKVLQVLRATPVRVDPPDKMAFENQSPGDTRA